MTSTRGKGENDVQVNNAYPLQPRTGIEDDHDCCRIIRKTRQKFVIVNRITWDSRHISNVTIKTLGRRLCLGTDQPHLTSFNNEHFS
jgi:hypothetical protein